MREGVAARVLRSWYYEALGEGLGLEGLRRKMQSSQISVRSESELVACVGVRLVGSGCEVEGVGERMNLAEKKWWPWRMRLLGLVIKCMKPWYLSLVTKPVADGYQGQCSSLEVKRLLAVNSGKFHQMKPQLRWEYLYILAY